MFLYLLSVFLAKFSVFEEAVPEGIFEFKATKKIIMLP